MSVAPSVSYSITVRLEVPSRGRAVSDLTHAVEQAGGAVTALDVTPYRYERLRVDVTCAARDTDHAEEIVQSMRTIPGVVVNKVSDRTFLLHLGGKIETNVKVPLRNRDDLSMAYTPGVARVSLAIAANPDDVRRLTVKRNSVAVVTDGSAVLGLGNVGPYAAMPVMEGKAALFKRFADIDAWPVCLDTQDTDEIVRTVQIIAPAFGGINLEDIGAPRCFEVERRLRELLDIPVFHDDQHGTAIVVLAQFLPLPGSGRMTCSGVRAGPSGTATSKTAPVSAIRLQPFFSPVPARFSKVRTRCSGALVRRRRASGSIATPLPSAESASGGRPGPGPPAAGTAAAWSRSWQNRSASAAAATTICSSCRLPTLTPVAASTNSCPCSYDTDRQNISASRCKPQEYPQRRQVQHRIAREQRQHAP